MEQNAEKMHKIHSSARSAGILK